MISIAIDGPAGAGKSTIAKRLAQSLNFIYVDTGALYRAIGYYIALNNVSSTDKENIIKLLDSCKVELKFIDGAQKVFLNDNDVTDKIRTPEMSMYASNVSAITEVRSFLFDLQRDIATNNNIIMDGRDIGTVVLPNADVKIFLTASCEERANRRYKEHIEKGEQVDYDKLLEDIKTRDYNDSHRAIAPLKQADDAVLIDTTKLNFEESVKYIHDTIQAKLGGKL